MPPKPLPPAEHTPEEDFHGVMTAAFGSIFEIEDRLAVRTHSGALFEGEVVDCNFAGIMIRLWPPAGQKTGELHFVSFTGIESSRVFEEDEPDDGDEESDDDGEEAAVAAPAGEAGAGITPITTKVA